MNFAKALRAALDRRYWPALRHGVVPTTEHAAALAGIEPATVLDVGANKGQFAFFASRRWPLAKLHAFEPLAGPRRTLSQLLGRKAAIYPFAIGACDGEAEINIGSRADSSSLLPIGANQTRIFGTTRASSQAIRVRRLENAIAPADLREPTLLKIDVQGFEYQVLEGLGALAELIDWVYVEVSYLELYEGQRLSTEVDGLLTDLGFCLAGTYNVYLDGSGQAIQADLLYARADSPPAR